MQRLTVRRLILGVAVLAIAIPASHFATPETRARVRTKWLVSRLRSSSASTRDDAARALLATTPVDPERFAEVIAAYARLACSEKDETFVVVVRRFEQPPRAQDVRASVPNLEGEEYVHSTSVIRTLWKGGTAHALDDDAIIELWSPPSGWPWDELSRGEGKIELLVLRVVRLPTRSTIRIGGGEGRALIRMWRPARILDAGVQLAVPLKGAAGDLIVDRVAARLAELRSTKTD